MDYSSMLKVVQQQNPKMPYREQQAKASEMLKEFKKAQQALAEGNLGYATKPEVPPDKLYPEYDPNAMPVRKVTMAELVGAEKRIRLDVADKNRIILIGREVLPDGHLETHGKDGVNTLVTFEDDFGNKIPVVGYFRVFL